MKNLLLVLIICITLAGCSATKIVSSWNQQGAEEKQYQKLGVVVMIPDMANRATVEDAVAKELRVRGIKASATFNTFPFAGKIGEVGLDSATIQQKIRQRVNDNHFDALLLIVLLDKRKEERYVEGSSISIGAPVYGYPYYGYYYYAYSTVYSSGYYTTSTSYFVECNLYDVASQKLVWTAQTSTENPTSIETESANFAKIIVDNLMLKKVMKP